MAFLTKTHLSRRTFLRGAGVTLALPLLDSMIPAATALGADGRQGRARGFGAIYFPHGAIMPKWTPATEGAGFELTRDPAAAQAVPRARSTSSATSSTRWPTAAAPRPITTARPRRS